MIHDILIALVTIGAITLFALFARAFINYLVD